jgi:rare lipoprotein A
VVLRITDRAPNVQGRGIDLSREAARRLRMVDQGVAKVRVELLTETAGIEPVTTAAAAWPSTLAGARALSL